MTKQATSRVEKAVRGPRQLLRFAMAVILSFTLITASVLPAYAINPIRDAEIENLLRDYASPIFKAAGLSRQNVRIHLIGLRSFNAFVVDGRNMFFHVGTLMKSNTPNQVIGVIAHETGHIAGGHLSRLRQAMSHAQSTTLMLRVLILAATAAGAAAGANVGAAGAGALLGGEGIAQRYVLSYRRAEESSADQAAISYLNATKQSGKGMLDTFAYLADQGLGSLKYADPYLQSHPLPAQRIANLRDIAKRSPSFTNRDSPRLQARHDLMRAKLSGFLDNPATVLNKYPNSDQSLPARYARTIATYRRSGIRAFLPKIDALIKFYPDNPYFKELKGQFLFESGETRLAIPPLLEAIKMAPKEPLIRILLAQALLADAQNSGRVNKATLDQVISHLRHALVKERCSAKGYRLLATAYGLKRNTAQAMLASAFAYQYEGKSKLAKRQAQDAKKTFSPGSTNWLKADDILKTKGSRC
jgi:predicted Zn-dependent protease